MGKATPIIMKMHFPITVLLVAQTCLEVLATANKSVLAPSDCCPKGPDCDEECCEAQAGPVSECENKCMDPPKEFAGWARCVKKGACSRECCEAQAGSVEECMNQQCCGSERGILAS